MAAFTYDCRNRLIKAETESGETTVYTYDAENNRIAVIKHAGTAEETTTRYVIDSGSGELTQVVKSAETDANGNEKLIYYFYGANRLLAREEYEKKGLQTAGAGNIDNKPTAVPGTYLAYHYNNVGSTTAVTDGNGAVKYSYDYSPYGDLIKGSYGEVAFLYNGAYGVASDDNGLYYMRARYYNIDIKRFINQDVLTGSIDRSQSLNRYAYVEGNPVSYLDPFGLEKVDFEKIHTAIGHATQILGILSGILAVAGIISPVIGAMAAIPFQLITILNVGLIVFDSFLYGYEANQVEALSHEWIVIMEKVVMNVLKLLTTGVMTGVANKVMQLGEGWLFDTVFQWEDDLLANSLEFILENIPYIRSE